MSTVIDLLLTNSTGNTGLGVWARFQGLTLIAGDVIEWACQYSPSSPNPNAVQEEAVWVPASGPAAVMSWPDQNGFDGAYNAAGVFSLPYWQARRSTMFIRRVVVPANAGGELRLGIRSDAIGTQRLWIAFARVRRINDATVQWLWRPGMAAPLSLVESVSAPDAAHLCLSDALGHLPPWCEAITSEESIIDDRQIDRAVSGRLRSRAFFDHPRREFRIRYEGGLRLNETQREQLAAFYEVFGRESFLYTPRASEPRRVEFAEPPRWREVAPGGVYEAEVRLQEV